MSLLTRSCHEAYQEGFDAYYDGAGESENPYPSTSDEFMSWNDGWMVAQDEEDSIR